MRWSGNSHIHNKMRYHKRCGTRNSQPDLRFVHKQVVQAGKVSQYPFLFTWPSFFWSNELTNLHHEEVSRVGVTLIFSHSVFWFPKIRFQRSSVRMRLRAIAAHSVAKDKWPHGMVEDIYWSVEEVQIKSQIQIQIFGISIFYFMIIQIDFKGFAS